MTTALVRGDPPSCSRVGGDMRRESSRMRQHAHSLADALGELAAWKGPEAAAAKPAILAALTALRAAADLLDEAGAALQGYATELAEAHELGRRAELRVQTAGLLLEGTRVVEPWGPAGALDSVPRRAQVPDAQARVDLATVRVGRARGRLGRDMTRLAQAFSALPAPKSSTSGSPGSSPPAAPARTDGSTGSPTTP